MIAGCFLALRWQSFCLRLRPCFLNSECVVLIVTRIDESETKNMAAVAFFVPLAIQMYFFCLSL